jgi:enamine deaminase RidA (YjgF/YER057c/UK114 family)
VRTSPMNPDTVAPPVGNYSHAVRVDVHDGVLLFVSGQVAIDRRGNLVGAGDMARQTEQAFENLDADMTQLQAVRDVRARYVPDPPPASTTVQVAGLFRPDALIEVEVVAAIPGTTREGG